MSILLEALRKSEKNQREHEAPTIHSDDQTGSVSEPIPTGALIILLLTGLFLSGWFVWRQYQPPASISQPPPVTLPAAIAPAVTEPVVQDKEPAQDLATDSATDSTISASSGQQRTPVESFQPAVNAASTSNPGVQAPPVQESAAAVSAGEINHQTGTDVVTAAPADGISSNSGTSDQPVKVEEEPFSPGEPAPVGYWDLPDAVRAEVPEIKFSVLVYATDPADRFVLISGQRLGEGDSARPGLVVKEIRRDGVIFTYRLYQFLVER